jgi:hypothetical protein
MKLNHDYSLMMRTGSRLHRTQYRKEIESGIVLFWSMAGALAVLLIAATIK